MTLTLQNCWHHHEAHTLAVDEAPGNSILAISECSHLHTSDNIWKTYWTDFSEYKHDLAPGDWAETYWNASVGNVLAKNDEDCEFGDLGMRVDYTSANFYAANWTKVPLDYDFDILIRFKQDQSTTAGTSCGVRIYGTTSEYGYTLWPSTSNPWTFRTYKLVNGMGANLDAGNYQFTIQKWYWIRLRAWGDQIKSKIWEHGEVEPAAWFYEGTNAQVPGPGAVAVTTYSGDGVIDYFSVGVGGIAAPMEGPTLYVHNGINEIVSDNVVCDPAWLKDMDASHAITDPWIFDNFASLTVTPSGLGAWSEDDDDNNISIVSEKAHFAGNTGSHLFGQWPLQGDFDFIVPMEIVAMAHNSTVGVQVSTLKDVWEGGQWAWFKFSAYGSERHGIYRDGSSSSNLLYEELDLGEPPFVTGLRFTRVDSTIKVYYWQPIRNRWEYRNDPAGLTYGESHTDDLYVSFQVAGAAAYEMDVPSFLLSDLEVRSGVTLYVFDSYHVHTASDLERVYTAWTDFSAGTRGTWTEYWNPTWGATAFDSQNSPQWADINAAVGVYVSRHYWLVWADHGPLQDMEILARICAEGNTTSPQTKRSRLGVRSYSQYGTVGFAYFTNLNVTDNLLELRKAVSESATDTLLDSHAHTILHETWYWVRLRVQRRTVQAKIWDDGAPEPATWDVEATDADVTTSGYPCIGQFMDGGSQADKGLFDVFSLGLGGATAPYIVNPAPADQADNLDLVDQGPMLLNGLWIQDAYHDVVSATPDLQIVFVVETVNDTYHDLIDDGPLPAQSVYPDDAYHLNVPHSTQWDDDFTGSDSDPANPKLWTETDAWDKGDILDNKWRIDADEIVATDEGNLESKYVLAGDFSIQIDVDIISLGQPGVGSNIPSRLQVEWGANYAHIGKTRHSPGVYAFYIQSTTDGFDEHQNATATYKMRLVRSGTTLTAYYWDNNQWEWDGSTDGYTFTDTVSGDCTVEVAWFHQATTVLIVDWDNFKVNYGATFDLEQRTILAVADAYHDLVDDFAEVGFTYWTDFSEYEHLEVPADWADTWDTAAMSFVIDNAVAGIDFGPNALKFTQGTGYSCGYSTRSYGVDQDVVARIRIDENTDSVGGLGVRCIPGAEGERHGYGFLFNASGDELRHARYASGGVGSIWFGNTDYTLDVNKWYWARVRTWGDQVKIKVWDDRSPEPAEWNLETTDAGVAGPGYCGLWTYYGNFSCDYFAYGLGGAEAPLPMIVHNCSHDVVSDNVVCDPAWLKDMDTYHGVGSWTIFEPFDSLRTTWWDAIYGGTAVSIVGGKLHLEEGGDDAYLYMQFPFVGDFDFAIPTDIIELEHSSTQIHFCLRVVHPQGPISQESAAAAAVANDEWHNKEYYTLGFSSWTSTHGYHRDANGSTEDLWGTDYFDLVHGGGGLFKGAIRFQRVGSTLKCWYWHPPTKQWEYDGSTDGYTLSSTVTLPLWLMIRSYASVSSYDYKADIPHLLLKDMSLGGISTLANLDAFHEVTDHISIDSFDSIDPLVWNEDDPDACLSVVNGKLHFDGAAFGAGLFSQKKILKGDFDIIMPFEIDEAFTHNSYVYLGVGTINTWAGGVYSYVSYANYSSSRHAHFRAGSSTSNTYSQYWWREPRKSIARITRTGSTIKGYLWEWNEDTETYRWEYNKNTAGLTFSESHTDDMYIIVRVAGAAGGVLVDIPSIYRLGDMELLTAFVKPNDCYHENIHDPTDLTIVHVGGITLVMTDDGAYHDLEDDGPLPATQVYPDDAYHLHVTSDPLWWLDDAYHDLVDDGPLPATQVYPDDCFHLVRVDNGADLVLVQTGAIVNLTMTDDGAFHLNVPDNVVIDPAWVYPVDTFHLHEVIDNSIWWLNSAYHELVDDGPLPAVQLYPDDCYHLHTAPELPATQVYPDDCFHLNVVAPTDLDVSMISYLVMSDAGVNYHPIFTNVDNSPIDLEITIVPDDCDHDTFSNNISLVAPLFLRIETNIIQVWSHYNLQLQTDVLVDLWGMTSLNKDTGYGGSVRRSMGNLSPNPSGKVLYITAFNIYSGNQPTEEVRFALYQFDSGDSHPVDGNMSGADLIIDAGESTNAPWTQGWNEVAVSKISIRKNAPTFIAWKSDSFFYWGDWAAAGPQDFQAWSGGWSFQSEADPWFGPDRSSDTAWENPSPIGAGGGGSLDYFMGVNAEFEYESADQLQVNDALHIHHADGFIATWSLGVDECYHLQVAANVVIDPAWANTQDAYHLHTVSDPLWWVDDTYHVLFSDEIRLSLPVLGAYHDVVSAEIPLGVVLVVAGSDHVSFSDVLAFTQLHILDPGDCAHEVIVNDGVDILLDEWELLRMDDCWHELVGTVDVTQLHILGLDACYHLHVLPPPLALTQEHNLTALDAFSLHVPSVLSLTQEHTLIVDSQPCLHFVEVIELGLHLIISSCAHETFSDAFAFTQEHNLTVADDYLLHVPDNVAMVVPILVEDCAQEVTSDSDILLTALHYLAVVGTYHDHVVTGLLILFQLHFLEVAGTGMSTDYNYSLVFSTEIDFGYLPVTLGGADLTIVEWRNP